MNFLNNQWLIGIGTSIISGIIVFFITKKFFSTKENKEYSQKVKTANNEILYAIRPLVVQKKIPQIDIINSLILSISNKYNVVVGDLYKITSLINDLINEVMSNAFLSSEQKLELCNLLQGMKQTEKKDADNENIIDHKADSKAASTTYLSLIVSIMASMMALMVFVFNYFKEKNMILTESKLSGSFLITFITVLIAITTLTMTAALKIFKDKEIARRLHVPESKEFDDSEKLIEKKNGT